MNKSTDHLKLTLQIALLATLAILLVYYASPIIMPMLFSVFVAVALLPLSRKLEKIGLGRTLAALVVVGSLTLTVIGILYLLFTQLQNLMQSLPDLSERFDKWMNVLSGEIAREMEISSQEQKKIIESNSENLVKSNMGLFKSSLNMVKNALTFMSVTPFYMLFLMIYRSNFRAALRLLSQNQNIEDRNLSIIKGIEGGLQKYLKGLLIVTTLIAVMNAIGFLSLGLDYAILLAVLAAILTVIPYVGVIIGAFIPALVALVTKDSLFYPAMVLAIAAIIQFLEGNFITPRIIGNQVGVNPLFIIITVIIMGTISGILGMMLSAPILAVAKIICTHVEALRPVGVMLSDKAYDYEQAEQFATTGVYPDPDK